MTTTIVTAIKPTGTPHLGNFVGAISPTLTLAKDPKVRVAVFVADGHALNTTPSPDVLRSNTFEVVATYLACGLDPARVLLYRQSDVPEVFELASLLACVCPKGLANRAHAYKALVERNVERGDDPDDAVNMGLFEYPILMAADILAIGATEVPVGPDQVQHIELARELVRRFNHTYGDVLEEPRARLSVSTCVPGTDGRKMSKSYDNTIDLFASPESVRRQVSRIRTSSRRLGEPGDPDDHLVLSILAVVADPEITADACERLRRGAGDGELKQVLCDALGDRLAARRDRFQRLIADRERVEGVLRDGAREARARCARTLERVKRAAGLA